MKINKSYKIGTATVLYVVLSSFTYAEPEKTISPHSIAGTTKVSAEKIIELANQFSDLVIVDSRIAGDRQKGYIESSVSLPDEKTNCQSLSKLLSKKTTNAVFYCNGVKCGRSVKAIKVALKCGYKNLYWFRGGFEVWLEKGLPYMKD